jgi:hypothetical protein
MPKLQLNNTTALYSWDNSSCMLIIIKIKNKRVSHKLIINLNKLVQLKTNNKSTLTIIFNKTIFSFSKTYNHMIIKRIKQ